MEYTNLKRAIARGKKLLNSSQLIALITFIEKDNRLGDEVVINLAIEGLQILQMAYAEDSLMQDYLTILEKELWRKLGM